MSGVVAVMAAAGGQQVPVLQNATYDFVVATSDSGVLLILQRGGALLTSFNGDSGPHSHPPQWGGNTPFSTMGDSYEARLTNVSGSLMGDPEFSQANIWYALSVDRQWKSFSVSSSGLYTSNIKMEIRRASNQQVLASANYTLQWREV